MLQTQRSIEPGYILAPGIFMVNAEAHLKRQPRDPRSGSVMGPEAVGALMEIRLDLGVWEQILGGEFDSRQKKHAPVTISARSDRNGHGRAPKWKAIELVHARQRRPRLIEYRLDQMRKRAAANGVRD